MLRVASILALVLLSVACSNSFKAIEEQKDDSADYYKYCPDDTVPADLPMCSDPVDIGHFIMRPQPKSSTTACEIVLAIIDETRPIGSVARDGRVHWWCNEDKMNPRMRERFRQACAAAVKFSAGVK